VEAISKAMKQRAADLKLPMPQLVVGQNIETWASPVVYQFETTHLKAGSPLFQRYRTWKNLGSISVSQLLLLVFERMFDFLLYLAT